MRRAAVVLFSLLAVSAHAGGPLVVATDGTPVGWSTAAPVPYVTDLGGLGLLANADAVGLVGTLFGTWQAVPTTTIRFARAGATSVDVDASNFGPFLGPYGGATTRLGQNAIVFDRTGQIFDTLFGVGTAVIGFAGPTFLSDGRTTVAIGDPVPPGARIVEAVAFLNGKFIDGVDTPAAGNAEMSLARFQAVFVHEFGHFAGLDHTQIHGLSGPPESDSPRLTGPVETMFPFAVDETQATLGRDDAVSISTLYPTASFAQTTGRITGRVLASDGTPFSGADVIARNVADDSDAVSWVSGATLVNPGAFTLAGLTPGATYTVEVQPIDAFHAGGSRVGPFSPPVVLPGPPEYWNAGESADPARDDPRTRTTITATAGGTVPNVDLVLNRQRFAVTNLPLDGGSQPQGLAIADFDRDGIPDLVTTQFGFDPGNLVRFYHGLGGGAFATPVTIDSFPGNAHVVAGQLNAAVDDFPDVAVASDTLKAIRVYFGNGAGGFTAPSTVLDLPNTGPFLPGLTVADLDGDPFPDLFTLVEADDGSAVAYALRGLGTGLFDVVATPLAAGSGFPRGGLVMGRFTGGPAIDVAGVASGGGAQGPPTIGILIGDGTGGFVPATMPLAAISNVIGRDALAAGDFDRNGTLDLAVSDVFPVGGPNNWTRSFIDLFLGDGAGNFVISARYPVPETSQTGIVVADLDGDGLLDVASTGAVFGPGSPGAKVTVAYGDGTGHVRNVDTIWGLAEFPTDLVAADLNGDGRLDLLVNDAQSSAFGLPPAPALSVLLQQSATPPPTTSTSTTTTTTTTTSTTTSTVPPSLGAIADTYVESGSQATWDHGIANHVDTSRSPDRVAYLKFDLRAVTGTVARAQLTLRTTDPSADAGTIYAVADSTWVEGTQAGTKSSSAKGPGLKWNDVDTNRDGTLDARDTSPWLPDFARPIVALGKTKKGALVVDVTAAFQRGPGLYTLAIRSTNKDRGAFGSREASSADRPRLTLQIGP
jgi:hypothetical protein